ncbi:MAG: DUF4160 domain-containing protein [Selenomonadaceae bacterium]|nr:DUF4160 domain-containing protein [Selenomonadaceae bacterium]
MRNLPQVCRLLGYLIFFWSNENNEPLHVHVCKGKPQEDATKIWLEDEPRLEHNKSRIPAKDLNRIMQWLATNKSLVETKWNEHFK